MKKDKLLREISLLLAQHEENADFEVLWDELKPHLPKKRKNPTLVWAIIAFGIAGLGLYLFIPKENILRRMDKSFSYTRLHSNDNLNIQASSSAHTISGQATLSLSTQILHKPSSYLPLDKKSRQQHSLKTSGNSSLTQRQNGSGIISHKKHQRRVGTHQITKKTPKIIPTTPIARIKKKTKYILLDGLTIAAQMVGYTIMLPNQKNPNLAVGPSPNRRLPHWSFNVGMQFIYQHYIQGKNHQISHYGEQLNNTLTRQNGYMWSSDALFHFSNGFFVGMGLSTLQTWETFRINNMISLEEREAFNPEAIQVQAGYIGAYQQQRTYLKQDILHNNTYQNWEITSHFGYRFDGNLHTEIAITPRFILSQQYRGFLITPEGRAIQTGDLFLQQTYKKWSIGGHLAISFPLKNRWFVGGILSYNKRYYLHEHIIRNLNSTQFFGVGVHVRRDL